MISKLPRVSWAGALEAFAAWVDTIEYRRGLSAVPPVLLSGGPTGQTLRMDGDGRTYVLLSGASNPYTGTPARPTAGGGWTADAGPTLTCYEDNGVTGLAGKYVRVRPAAGEYRFLWSRSGTPPACTVNVTVNGCGSPVVGASVTLTPTGGGTAVSGTTGSGGLVSLHPSAGGSYTLVVSSSAFPGWATSTTTVNVCSGSSTSSSVTVNLTPTGPTRISVSATKCDGPVTGAVFSAGGFSCTVPSGSSGCVITPTTPIPYPVTVTGTLGSNTVSQVISGGSGCVPFIVLNFPGTSGCTICVTGCAGKPLPGASVTLSTGESGTTGADGCVTFPANPAWFDDTITATASHPQFTTQTSSAFFAGCGAGRTIDLVTNSSWTCKCSPVGPHAFPVPPVYTDANGTHSFVDGCYTLALSSGGCVPPAGSGFVDGAANLDGSVNQAIAFIFTCGDGSGGSGFHWTEEWSGNTCPTDLPPTVCAPTFYNQSCPVSLTGSHAVLNAVTVAQTLSDWPYPFILTGSWPSSNSVSSTAGPCAGVTYTYTNPAAGAWTITS